MKWVFWSWKGWRSSLEGFLFCLVRCRRIVRLRVVRWRRYHSCMQTDVPGFQNHCRRGCLPRVVIVLDHVKIVPVVWGLGVGQVLQRLEIVGILGWPLLSCEVFSSRVDPIYSIRCRSLCRGGMWEVLVLGSLNVWHQKVPSERLSWTCLSGRQIWLRGWVLDRFVEVGRRIFRFLLHTHPAKKYTEPKTNNNMMVLVSDLRCATSIIQLHSTYGCILN